MKSQDTLKELRAKDSKDLNKELVELNQKIAKFHLDAAMRRLKNVKSIQESKHRVARIWTILNERAMSQIEDKNEVVK